MDKYVYNTIIGENNMKLRMEIMVICLIICLFGVTSVVASDINETVMQNGNQSDELIMAENQDICNINDSKENNEVTELTSYETDDLKSAEIDDEVLSSESDDVVVGLIDCDDEIVAVSDCGNDVLNIENGGSEVSSTVVHDDTVLTASAKNEKLSGSWEYYPADNYTKTKSEYKTFYVGQLKIPKKYKKFANGYKPPKKNKKAWKKYNAYKKIAKKQLKKFQKYCLKVFRNANNKHWNFLKNTLSYKTKYRGKYMYMKCYCKAYRNYYYNP